MRRAGITPARGARGGAVSSSDVALTAGQGPGEATPPAVTKDESCRLRGTRPLANKP